MSKGPWGAKKAIESYVSWAEAKGIFPDEYGKYWRDYQSWLIDQAQVQLRKLALREGSAPDKSGISYDDMEYYFMHRFSQDPEKDEMVDKPLLGKTILRAHMKGGTLRFNHIFYLFRLAKQTIVSDGCDVEDLTTEDVGKNVKSLIEKEEKVNGRWDRSSIRIEDWSMDTLAYTQVLSRIVREAKGHPDKTYIESAKDLLRCVEKVLYQISSIEENTQKKDRFSRPGSGFSATILTSVAAELNAILLSSMSTGNPRRETAFMMMCIQRFKENLQDPAYKTEVEQHLADSEGDSHTFRVLLELDNGLDTDAEDFSDEMEDYDDAYEADSLETELEWDRYKHHED